VIIHQNSSNCLFDCAVGGYICHQNVIHSLTPPFRQSFCDACLLLLRTNMWSSYWRPKYDNWQSSFGFQLQCLCVVITIGFHWIGLRILNPLSLFERHIGQLIEMFFDILHSISLKTWDISFWFSLDDMWVCKGN